MNCGHWLFPLVYPLVKQPLKNAVPIERPTDQQPSLVVPHFGSCPLRQQLLVDPVSPGQRVLRRGDAWKLAGAGVVPWDLKMKFI